MKATFLTTLCLTGIASLSAHAQLNLTWGGVGFDASIYSADGEKVTNEGFNGQTRNPALDDYRIQLGVFLNPDGVTDFTPSLQNASQWQDRWVELPTGPASTNPISLGGPLALGADHVITDDGFFGTEFTFGNDISSNGADQISNSDGFPIGAQLYIWGFNTQVAGPTAEWVLFTGQTRDLSNPLSTTTDDVNWRVPDSSIQTHNPLNPTLDVVTGNNLIIGRSSESTGGGVFDPTPSFGPSGDGDFQFARIPEPSTSLMLLLASLSLVIRRR